MPPEFDGAEADSLLLDFSIVKSDQYEMTDSSANPDPRFKASRNRGCGSGETLI